MKHDNLLEVLAYFGFQADAKGEIEVLQIFWWTSVRTNVKGNDWRIAQKGREIFVTSVNFQKLHIFSGFERFAGQNRVGSKMSACAILCGQFRAAARKPAWIQGLRAFYCPNFHDIFDRAGTAKKANQKDSNPRQAVTAGVLCHGLEKIYIRNSCKNIIYISGDCGALFESCKKSSAIFATIRQRAGFGSQHDVTQ